MFAATATKAYFLMGGFSSADLWITDGPARGTKKLLTGLTDYIRFRDGMAVTTSGTIETLSTGTDRVTVKVGEPASLTVVGDLIYFSNGEQATGRELRVTDGQQ